MTRFNLRIPRDLVEWLRAEAGDSGSVQSYILNLLYTHVSEVQESRCTNPITMFWPGDTEGREEHPKPAHRPVTKESIEEWKRMDENGWSIRVIARSENRSTETIWKYLHGAGDRTEKLADFKKNHIPPTHNKPFMG